MNQGSHTKRSAPKDGYDFGSKRQYRSDVWAGFREFCDGRLSRAQALLMPSLEGDEIKVALTNGFREENLHVVDQNPAIVATLKRRYRKINTYGVSLDRAIARMGSRQTQIDVANLDLCGPVSERLIWTLKNLMVSEVMRGNAPVTDHHDWTVGRVAITVLRGREYGKVRALVTGGGLGRARLQYLEKVGLTDARQLPLSDCARLVFLLRGLSVDGATFAALARHDASGRPRYGIYPSTAGHLTMLWAIFDVIAKQFDRIEIDSDDAFRPALAERVVAQKQLTAGSIEDTVAALMTDEDAHGNQFEQRQHCQSTDRRSQRAERVCVEPA